MAKNLETTLLEKIDTKQLEATCTTCKQPVTEEDGILFVDSGKNNELFYFFLCLPCFEQNRALW